MKKKSKGFSLVELLVALAVGTLVVIGAGQLFLVTLDTYKQVEVISRNQEAVVFSAHVLANSYRQGRDIYDMREAGEFCEIINDDKKVIIDGLLPKDDACDYFPPKEEDGFYEVILIFPAVKDSQDEISFKVMNRNAVFPESDTGDNTGDDTGSEKTPDPDDEGFYIDGTKIYNDRCYNGSGKFKPDRAKCNAP
ncbi:prepilin-type N-terminal cleavage/methylation domain-containing protein [Halomonas sp. BLK-85]